MRALERAWVWYPKFFPPMRSNGLRGPRLLQAASNRARFSLQRALVKDVAVNDGEFEYLIRCGDGIEVLRAMTLRVKEEGTFHWLTTEVRGGDIFCDVGANIGIYALVAARRVGGSGHVYAFEPHVANLRSLQRNVAANGLLDRVVTTGIPLTDEAGFFSFEYHSSRAGSSSSQLLTKARAARQDQLEPSELKYGTTLDRLVHEQVVEPPNLVKIDVDGAELRVLRGMTSLLTSPMRPRGVQVEVDPSLAEEIDSFMALCGFVASQRHDTIGGKQLIAAGRPAESVVHNMIFRPRPA